ncbi:hypothetical protein WDU94_005304 [Cyamophila willieti]
MGTSANHTRGISKLEPQVLLQTSTEDFMRSTPRSAFDYVKTQFLKVDKVELEKYGLNVDDVFLMDRIYMHSSALPYFLTRGMVRKSLVSKMSINESVSSSNVIQHEKDHTERHSSRRDMIGTNGVRPQNMNIPNNRENQELHSNNQHNFEYNKPYSQRFNNSRGPGFQNNPCAHGNNKESNYVNGAMSYNANINKFRHNNQRNGDTRTNKAMSNENNFSSSSADEGSICSIVSTSGNRPSSNFKDSKNNINVSPAVSNSEAISPQSDGKKSKKPKPLNDMIGNIRHHSQPASTSTIPNGNSPGASDGQKTASLVKEEKQTSHIESANATSSAPSVSEHESYNLIFGDKIHALAPCHYFVVKECDLAHVEKLHNQLKCETLQPWSNESGGKKVVILLDGKYYRGVIVQNTVPDIVGPSCIKLVDVGWYLALDPHHADNIYVLPENLKSVKPLAFTIHTFHPVHISRHSHATVVETEQSNEKIKSVTVKQVQLEVQKPSVTSPVEKKYTEKNNVLDNISTTQNPQESKKVLVTEPLSAVKDNQFKNAPVNQCKVELNKKIEVSFIASDEVKTEHKWVQNVQFADKILEWHAVVDQFDSPLTPNSLKPDDFCVKLFDEMWCRAKIVSCSPLTLFYIDFGNAETVAENTNDMKPMPEELSLVQPLAMKVQFYHENNNTVPMEFGNCFFVTPIETKGNVHIVLKDDETQPMLGTNNKTPVQSENSTRYYFKDAPISQTSSLEINKPVEVAFVQEDTNNAAHKWVQEVELYNYIEEWTNVSTNSTDQFGRKPEVGEFCVHFYEESWCRAQVVQIEPLIVFYIDYGNKETISKIEELKPLPKKLSDVKPLAYKIQFFSKASADLRYTFGNMFRITPVEVIDNVLIVLKDDETIQPKPRTKVPDQSQTSLKYYFKDAPISQTSSLEINKSVEVAFVQEDTHNAAHKWVQEVELYNYIEEWTNVSTNSTDQFGRKPEVGEFCVHFYEESWCRAQVVQLEPLIVFYIDYGNKETISKIEELKPLPKKLSDVKPLAYKIQFFSKASADLSYTFGNMFRITPVEVIDNVLIVLKDDEVIAKSDVKSLVYQSPVVNLTLTKSMEAAWVQDDEFDNQYTWVQDLTHIDQLEVIDNVMRKSSDKYAQMPKVGDLCAKFYEDMWCRTKVISTDPLTIFYIDFGNTEKIDNLDLLKPLPENLGKFQAFAFRVRFKNQKPTNLSFGDLFSMSPLSFENNVYTVSVE